MFSTALVQSKTYEKVCVSIPKRNKKEKKLAALFSETKTESEHGFSVNVT